VFSPGVADEHRLRVQVDAEPLPHTRGDLAGQRHQLGRGRVAAIDERERVLGGDPGASVSVPLVEAGAFERKLKQLWNPSIS